MTQIEGIIFILLIAVGILNQARIVRNTRGKIKTRLNREFENETVLSREELESRLGDSEIMYEELEETYWAHVGLLVGVATYFYWHIWWASILVTVLLIVVGCKYLSVKPFSTAIPG